MNGDDGATLAQIIGCNIKKLRVTRLNADGRARLQKECAEAVGATQQQWATWEAGKHIPGDEYLKAIAAMFGVTKCSLWTGDSPPAETSGEGTQPKQKPPAKAAEGASLNENIQAIMGACTTIDAALRQCLIDTVMGKIPEDDAVNLFGDIVDQIKAFHDEKRLADTKQATA